MALVRDVRAVLDRLQQGADEDQGDLMSRADLAADVLGSSHALDRGTRAEAAVTRALRLALCDHDAGLEDAGLWRRAGAHLDLVSGPVLVWNLPGLASTAMSGLLEQATGLGIPFHHGDFDAAGLAICGRMHRLGLHPWQRRSRRPRRYPSIPALRRARRGLLTSKPLSTVTAGSCTKSVSSVSCSALGSPPLHRAPGPWRTRRSPWSQRSAAR